MNLSFFLLGSSSNAGSPRCRFRIRLLGLVIVGYTRLTQPTPRHSERSEESLFYFSFSSRCALCVPTSVISGLSSLFLFSAFPVAQILLSVLLGSSSP